ncbi:hypothetical protein [Sediminibacillus massiliensis]|uniref:hypothetical protein n=1 Tax=Sediminibacillus massiliensis TaxID=1926277 RepID=UPI0009889115|nr:hypothetical protein [Sediminibacillus massiliensis]
MNCCCECGETKDIKVEGDVGADPIWCVRCGCNLDIEAIKISNRLIEELTDWGGLYGQWIDWDQDKLFSDGILMEDEFNQKGAALASRLKREVGEDYQIRFIPSTSARFYAKKS